MTKKTKSPRGHHYLAAGTPGSYTRDPFGVRRVDLNTHVLMRAFAYRKAREMFPHLYGPNLASWASELFALMTRPRAPRRPWHRHRWTRFYGDGSYEYMEPYFERSRHMSAGGHVSYGAFFTYTIPEKGAQKFHER